MAELGDNNPDVSIDFVELDEILEELADSQKEITEKTQSHRRKLKEILEDRDWNKTGLAMIRAIHKKSETARADLLRTFVPLFEEMWKSVWKEEQEDLLSNLDMDGGEEPEEEKQPEEAQPPIEPPEKPSPSAIQKMKDEQVQDVVFEQGLEIDRGDFGTVKAFKAAVVAALYPQQAAAE